jgi:hypothetical protein
VCTGFPKIMRVVRAGFPNILSVGVVSASPVFSNIWVLKNPAKMCGYHQKMISPV